MMEVQSRNDKGLDKKLCSMLCKEGPDIVQSKPAGSSRFCNVVSESELVIENDPKISDWA